MGKKAVRELKFSYPSLNQEEKPYTRERRNTVHSTLPKFYIFMEYENL